MNVMHGNYILIPLRSAKDTNGKTYKSNRAAALAFKL